jgi:hypothetical protein
MALIVIGSAFSSPVWVPTAPTSENNTPPVGLPSPTSRTADGSETNTQPDNTISIAALTADTTWTGPSLPPGASTTSTRSVNAPENTAPLTNVATVAAQPTDTASTNIPPTGTPGSATTTWYYGMFVIDVDADGLADDNVYFVLTDNVTPGVYENMNISLDNTTFNDGILTDNTVTSTDDEQLNGENKEVTIGAYKFYVEFNPDPTAQTDDAKITSRTWYAGTFTIDTDADGIADNTFYFALVDVDSDGLYENMDLSTDDDTYGEGVLNDLLTASDNDERLAAWGGVNVWLGSYRFLVDYDGNPAADVDDVRIQNRCWYYGTFVIDTDADGSADDDANFVLTDVDSDGVYENVDISVDDDTYGENAAALADNVADENNDERITASKDVRLDTYLFTVAFDNNPAADTNDVRITSKSWYFGTIVMDVDGDGSVDDNVNFCLSDNDSNGVFNVLEISADDNTYGESAATLADNVADENNDERLTAPENIRIGPYYDYTVIALVSNPAVASPDLSLRSCSWYVGTIGLVGNFKFVIWDNSSDGVFDRLTFDANQNDNYAGETHYSSAPSEITLPPGSAYKYRVLEFNTRPAYTDPDLRMRPLDNSPPELENLEPAQGAFISTRTPTIRARLEDRATDGIKFGIDPDWIRVKVNDNVVSHAFTANIVQCTPPSLPDGWVTVVVTARDLARNQALPLAWSFIVDATKPSLVIDIPLRITTENNLLVISGTVSDANFKRLLVAGREQPVINGRFSASVSLEEGLNTIVVRAEDKAGNENTIVIRATRKVPPSPAIYLVFVVAIVAIVVFAVVSFARRRAPGIPPSI